MSDTLVRKLRRICLDVAHEIEPASRGGDHALFAAAVKARDALVEMRAAAGDEEAAQVAEKYYSLLDEMMAITAASGYSGVGCRDCGPDTDVEGGAVEIDGSTAKQEVSCGQCGRVWVNLYRFVPPMW